MRWKLLLAGVVLLGLGFAGCLSDEGSPEAEDSSEETIASPNAAPEAAGTDGSEGPGGPTSPAWSIGDHWTYASEQAGEFRLVVTGEDGSNWTLDTTSEDIAMTDARDDLGFVGEIRKDDLAGRTNDSTVVFFDWPLEENKTWTTTWDGAEREVTVERIEEGRAHLTAREGERPVANYTYDAAAGTFGSLEFLGENGTTTFAMELTDHGSGFEGDALRWQLAEVLDLQSTYSQVEERPSGAFEVPDWAGELYVEFRLSCPVGGVFHFGSAPAGPLVFAQTQTSQGYKEQHECPADVEKAGVAHEDPETGTWGYGLETASPAGETSYELSLWARSLQTVSPADEG